MMRSMARRMIVAAALLVVPGIAAQTSIPEIAFDSAPNLLKMPADVYLGEVAGVASSAAGHLFVYTRTGNPTVGLGNSRLFSHGGSRLFEFDQNGGFVREIGAGMYASLVAQAVRVDVKDNIWIVDAGSGQLVKLGPDGRVLMVMGRKPEAISVRSAADSATAPSRGRGGLPGAGGDGDQFSRPADVAWDGEGNIYVADGLGSNSRIAKFDPNGRFLLSWGSRGGEPGQFSNPHSIAVDGAGLVYVADQGNKRIQVFDKDGAPKSQIAGIGVPTAICISGGSHQYLYSSHTGDSAGMDDAAIYKLELDGRLVGKFGSAGKSIKEFGLVNALECRTTDVLYVGELSNWRVQKVTLHPAVARH